MRKLASVQKVAALHPIPNADKIEVAEILGWKVVVEKGKHKEGELIVYCEIDCILPDRPETYPEFQFLKPKKFRIKTMRLRGQISQGICFPISILEGKRHHNLEEGEDVTETLGILKYIPNIPACLKGIKKGDFPSFIAKTDETRVQVLQDVLTRYKGMKCYVTEKVDGSSATYYIKDGQFGVCSRNLELAETEDNMFWKMARKLKLEEKMKTLGKNIAIQGELIGCGIQKNNLRLDENKVLFFNAFDIDKYCYCDFEDFVKTIKGLELEPVPFIDLYDLDDNIDNLLEMSKGKSKLNSKAEREGIVIRPIKETIDFKMAQGMGNGRLTFKAINTEYLLKYEE